MSSTAPKVGFVSLGCPKALVDSERIITQLRSEGYDLVPDYDGADLVVVNTCGFIDPAVEESLEAIGEALEENGKVIVTGCLGERADEITDVYPNVLAVTGAHAYKDVMDAVHTHLPAPHDPFSSLIPPQGIKLTPKHYAYLKISEGCNHRCSFCIIPSMRGDLESRAIGEIMQEAENLVKAGVKELLIVAQDSSAYGLDIKYRTGFWNGQPIKSRFYELAKALGELGIWVRMHYVYPYPHVDNVIPLMAEGKILPYLDVPLQHGSPRILKAMKRPAASEKALDRIQRWREICPDITLRSTFITGFPGETESEFQELLDFIQEAQLDRVGCFTYSPVAGAAANKLPNPVAEEVKQERQQRLMELQEGISSQRIERFVGRTLEVLVDEVNDEITLARTPGDAPEVDGVVFVEEAQHLTAGEFATVEIIGTDIHDLVARPVEG